MEDSALLPTQIEQFALHRLSKIPLPDIPPLGTVSPPGAKVTTRSTSDIAATVRSPARVQVVWHQELDCERRTDS